MKALNAISDHILAVSTTFRDTMIREDEQLTSLNKDMQILSRRLANSRSIKPEMTMDAFAGLRPEFKRGKKAYILTGKPVFSSIDDLKKKKKSNNQIITPTWKKNMKQQHFV